VRGAVFRLSLLPSGRHEDSSLPDLQRSAQYYHKADHGRSESHNWPRLKNREKIVKTSHVHITLLTFADGGLMLAMRRGRVILLCFDVYDFGMARAEVAQFMAYWSGIAFLVEELPPVVIG